MNRRILFASANEGKFAEAIEVAREFDITLVRPNDIGIPPEIAETGTTYEENAALKAEGYCAWSELPAISDDAGLEVAALGGEPGVFTKDFAPTGEERIAKVLAALDGKSDRRATFVSVCVYHAPDATHFIARGEVRGTIATTVGEVRSGVELTSIFVPEGESEPMVTIAGYPTHRVKALRGVFRRLVG